MRAHAKHRAAATMATMMLDDPSGYGRVIRDDDGHVEGVVETKVAGDATPEQLAIREVNSSIFAFDGAAVLAALRAMTPDNAAGRALPARRPAGAACGRPPGEDAQARRPAACARRQRPRPTRRGSNHRAGAHPRGPWPRGRDDRRPRLDADRRRRRDRRGHDDRAQQLPARRDADRPRLHRRPADDADRRHAARRGDDPALLRRRRGDRVAGDRRPVRLPAPRHGPARRLEGGHVRRDQELRRRAAAARFPTCPTSATPTSAWTRTSARRRSPPTTTASTSTARRSAIASTRASTRRSSPRSRSADDAYTAANSAITKNVPPGALGVARERQTQHRGLRRS